MTVAIIPQDDTGTVVDANAYDTVAAFKAYHALRGNDVTALSDDQIAVALIRATDYIDVRFTFPGIQLVKEDDTADPPVVAQTTAWPRQAPPCDGFSTFGPYGFPFGEFNPYGPTTIGEGFGGFKVPKGIPVALKKACHEYAFRAVTAQLFTDVTIDPSGRLVSSTTDKVDVIETSVTYQGGQNINGTFIMPAYPAADLYLTRAGLVVTYGKTVVR